MNINQNEFQQALWNNIKTLNTYVDLSKRKYSIGNEIHGIYGFWLNNHDGYVQTLNRNFYIKGPGNSDIFIKWDWNLSNEKICLYVGKSTDIKKRLSQHLMLGTEKLYEGKETFLLKKTTACQLRTGFDFLYLHQKTENIFKEMDQRLEFSFLKEEDFIKRFYLEDYLIGNLLPWFNVDSER